MLSSLKAKVLWLAVVWCICIRTHSFKVHLWLIQTFRPFRNSLKLMFLFFFTLLSCCSCPLLNLSKLVLLYQPGRSVCSAHTGFLIVPCIRLERFGRRSFTFTFSGLSIWNALPLFLCIVGMLILPGLDRKKTNKPFLMVKITLFKNLEDDGYICLHALCIACGE